MGRFSDQTCVVTGGTNGIGLATAKRIVAEGGRVLVSGLSDERLAAAAAMPGMHVLKSDASNPTEAEALADEAKKLFGQVDAVFLNAGKAVPALLNEVTQEKYREQFDLNVGGVLFGAKALAPIIRPGGAMLLMASGAKTKGIPGAILYAGSKGAVRSIALVLARELKAQGIRVNTISPGPIDTEFHAMAGHNSAETEEMSRMLKQMIPMGRMGHIEEAAAVATFLLSRESSFVTGADYPVDGGEAQL